MKRLVLFPVAFAAGWIIGAVVMVSVASWRLLRDMDRPVHKPDDILRFVEAS